MDIIITSPSLDPNENVSGISSVTRFIVDNNSNVTYHHFVLGKKDIEKGGWHRIPALAHKYREWKKMLDANPDAIVHYNFPLSKASLLRDPWFINYAVKQGRKMVVHVHGGLFLTAPKIPCYLRRIMTWVFGLDLPFVVLSDMEKDILTKRFGAKRVVSLPNCVDLRDAEDFARQASGMEESDESDDSIRPLRIGYLGRIEPNKGMTELLIACQRLKREGSPFHLVLAGKEQKEDEYLPQFDRWLGDSFDYSGLVSGKSKCEFLRNLDVFVMPTYFEGLPMSLLECMSYGVVPVVTPVGSIPQVVDDGKNGLLIKVKDVDGIVDAVSKLSNNRALLRSLSSKARATIFSQFSPAGYIAKLNSIYHSL